MTTFPEDKLIFSLEACSWGEVWGEGIDNVSSCATAEVYTYNVSPVHISSYEREGVLRNGNSRTVLPPFVNSGHVKNNRVHAHLSTPEFPNSRTSTCLSASSDNRLATVKPAVPPPTII